MSEQYFKMQNDLASKIIKAKTNYKRSPKERITLMYVEARLENLELIWKEFVDTHRKIVCEMKSEDYFKTEYFVKNVYEEIEEEFLYHKAQLKEQLYKFKVKSNDNDQRSSESRKVFVKLPEIALPKFSGKYSEWANYKDMFNSLIHKNESLDDVQKLHYLKGSLTGEAENLVRSINITADNYQICWDRLESRYDNKRSMANSIIRRLMNQKTLTQESATAIRQLSDTTSECLQSLRNMGVSTSSWDLILIYVVSQRLDPKSRLKWEAKMSESSRELPKFEELEEFLETRFRSLEYKVSDKDQTLVTNNVKPLHMDTTDSISCEFCSEKHKLKNCNKFLKESIDARRQFVQNKHLCYNCLSSEHTVYECTVSTTCRLCKKRHHTLLHPKMLQICGPEHQPEKGEVVAGMSNTNEPEAEEVESPEVLTSCFSTSQSTVILATALVNVSAQTKGSSASVLRSLLDQGSQASFLSESAAQLLGLKRIKETVRISGVGGSGSLESKSSVNIRIASRSDPSFFLDVQAHVLEKVNASLPSNKVCNMSQLKTLPSLELADPSFSNPGGIDLLLGADVYSKIMMEGLFKSENGSFMAQKTKFGWILSGLLENSTSENQLARQLNCHKVTVSKFDNDALLKKLESEPILNRILTQEEEACEKLFATTTRRDQYGRFTMKLPFKYEDPSSNCSGSMSIARKRFLSLEKGLFTNSTLKTEYSKANEYLALAHMEVCVDVNKQDAVCLPHHAMMQKQVKDVILEERKKKVKCHVTVTDEGDDSEDLLSRFSSLKGLTHVVSFCRKILRWKESEKENTGRLDYALTAKEMNESFLTCIKMYPTTHFQQEIQSLKTTSKVKKKNKLISLNHISLIGGRLHNASLYVDYEASNIISLKRWHLNQRMVQDFWCRWSEEYLTQLQHRYRWTDQIPEPLVGDVVLVKEDGLPPARWLYGLVIDKYPGKDGLTRVVSLKCKGQVIKRLVSN